MIVGALLFLLVALGGVMGMPLIGAAAAWECNGTLDAISRAFSYVFARPLQYFWNYFLIFMFLGVVLLVGHWFTYTAVKTVDNGIWQDRYSVLIDAPAQKDNEGEDFAEFDAEAKTLQRELKDENGYEQPIRHPGLHMAGARQSTTTSSKPNAMHFSAVLKAPWYHKLTAFIWWVLLNLIWLGFFGYAVFWLLGATSCVYADLRADVDGTTQDDIFLPFEEERYEALANTGPVIDGAAAEQQAKDEATATPSAEPDSAAMPTEASDIDENPATSDAPSDPAPDEPEEDETP